MISKTVGFIYCNRFCYLQSMSKACPSLPRTDTNWSIMPQGTPAWVCSACWQATALDTLSPSSVEKDIQRRPNRSHTTCKYTFSRFRCVRLQAIDLKWIAKINRNLNIHPVKSCCHRSIELPHTLQQKMPEELRVVQHCRSKLCKRL